MNSNSHEEPFLGASRDRQEQIQRTNRIWEAANSSGEQQVDNRVTRPLTMTEISTLSGPTCNSKCQDWSKLRLLVSHEEAPKDQSPSLQQLISFNTFAGVVVIGLDEAINQNEEEGHLPPGIHSNALISNCILDVACRVYRNMCISNTFVGRSASVLNCSRITCAKNVTYGTMKLVVGPESGGGRHVAVTAESTMFDVCETLGASATKKASKPMQPTICSMNCIGAGCLVRDTPTIDSICLAPNSNIEGATSVSNAVLLPMSLIGNACTVKNVMLQWNASIMDHSYISDVLLMEHAHAGPKSVVAQSLLGPDVHVSAGEVHASVIGPNTNAHHQSLVIGVLWLLGRGNVGYGANVGSNHTGRLPDQETCSGEGIFWGLSCVAKFPVDLSYSPYSIVAAGTTVGPQRISMPFSLLVDVNSETQIIPGWLLQSSPYTLTRNAQKYANRRKATHHKFYTGWNLIRPDIIDMCWVAREALRGVVTVAAEYKMLPGIGSTTISEKGRQSGIHAYTQCIQRYALAGLLEWIQNNRGNNMLFYLEQELHDVNVIPPKMTMLDEPSWPNLPWESEESYTWIHQKSMLQSEFPRTGGDDLAAWLAELLRTLVKVETDYASAVYKSKKRDDIRGADTIPGYKESHIAAEDDEVIKGSNEAARQKAQVVESLLADMSHAGVPSASRSRL